MRYAAKQTAPDAAVLIFVVELPVVSEGHAGNAELFFRLAARGLQHLLISLHYATGGGVQHARLEIFRFGTTLHQDFAHPIMNNNVGRAMTQTLRAHLFAAGLCYHLVVFINNIDPFCACQMILFRHQETLLFKALSRRVYTIEG